MDEVDCAQEREERSLKARIDSHRQFDGLNETDECIDCGEIIPEARRKAIQGCERCVACQEDYEKQGKCLR